MDLEQATRLNVFSSYIDKDEFGMEIGPSYRPTFSKREGWNSLVLDHLNQVDLVEKYRNYGVEEKMLNQIEEVDFVWNGEPYSEVLRNFESKLKWVTAAHVIEHSNDLITFFTEISEVLDDGGFLFLAVPDKKATFDFYRPNTTIGDIVACHLNPNLYDVKAHLDEEYFKCKLDEAIAWNRETSIRAINASNFPKPTFPVRNTIELVMSYLSSGDAQGGEYRDAHRWVFTPQSLCDVIRFLDNAGIVSFRIVEVSTPSYYEFLVVLQKNTVNQPRVLDLSRNEEFLIDLTPNFMLESINFSNAAELTKPREIKNNRSVIQKIKILLRSLKEIKHTNHSKSK
jgi:hypothetical protein